MLSVAVSRKPISDDAIVSGEGTGVVAAESATEMTELEPIACVTDAVEDVLARDPAEDGGLLTSPEISENRLLGNMGADNGAELALFVNERFVRAIETYFLACPGKLLFPFPRGL